MMNLILLFLSLSVFFRIAHGETPILKGEIVGFTDLKRPYSLFPKILKSVEIVAEGFGKKPKNSQPKSIITNPATLSLLARMAKFAEKPYLSPRGNRLGLEVPDVVADFEELALYKEFIIFVGSRKRMGPQEWASRIPSLQKYKKIGKALVDGEWLRNSVDIALKAQRFIIDFLKNTNAFVGLKIYFTGHGLGGVYALLAAVQLKETFSEVFRGDPNISIEWIVVTFGEPRIGNAYFAKYVNSLLTLYRVTNKNDHFPHQPKIHPIEPEYMHHELEYWISDDCDCAEINGEPKIYKCPGYNIKASLRYGENPECSLSTDGSSTTAHFGPYFGTTFPVL
ncbi:hypothetical protein G9A89_001437 [Geosiphon pyriformis]|nr:hypothetical protein G9A89_001437 [Geosiphon pyriformis]